jgi:hypothetical protein
LPETAPAPFQAEASALPRAPQTPLHQWSKKSPLNLNKFLPQFRESGTRQAHALNSVTFF